MNLLFPAESHSSGGFLVLELVIHSGITIPLVEFLILELALPGRITLYTALLQTATFVVTIPPMDSSSLS
jgi:hypothetical protein